jgi:hypothetical protein
MLGRAEAQMGVNRGPGAPFEATRWPPCFIPHLLIEEVGAPADKLLLDGVIPRGGWEGEGWGGVGGGAFGSGKAPGCRFESLQRPHTAPLSVLFEGVQARPRNFLPGTRCLRLRPRPRAPAAAPKPRACPHAVDDNDALLRGADHAVVKGLGQQDGRHREVDVGGLVDDGGRVAGAWGGGERWRWAGRGYLGRQGGGDCRGALSVNAGGVAGRGCRRRKGGGARICVAPAPTPSHRRRRRGGRTSRRSVPWRGRQWPGSETPRAPAGGEEAAGGVRSKVSAGRSKRFCGQAVWR